MVDQFIFHQLMCRLLETATSRGLSLSVDAPAQHEHSSVTVLSGFLTATRTKQGYKTKTKHSDESHLASSRHKNAIYVAS